MQYLTMQVQLPDLPPTLLRATRFELQRVLLAALVERCNYPVSAITFTAQYVKLCENPLAVDAAGNVALPVVVEPNRKNTIPSLEAVSGSRIPPGSQG